MTILLPDIFFLIFLNLFFGLFEALNLYNASTLTTQLDYII